MIERMWRDSTQRKDGLNNWLNGCADKWVDGWMMDGWVDRWVDEWGDEYVGREVGGWMDEQINGEVVGGSMSDIWVRWHHVRQWEWQHSPDWSNHPFPGLWTPEVWGKYLSHPSFPVPDRILTHSNYSINVCQVCTSVKSNEHQPAGKVQLTLFPFGESQSFHVRQIWKYPPPECISSCCKGRLPLRLVLDFAL